MFQNTGSEDEYFREGKWMSKKCANRKRAITLKTEENIEILGQRKCDDRK